MKLQLKEGVRVEGNVVTGPHVALTFHLLTEPLKECLTKLLQGCEKDRLTEALDGDEEFVQFFFILNTLKKHALVCYSNALIELIPLNTHFQEEDFLLPQNSFEISRFAFCRSHNGCCVIETPLSAARIQIKTQEALPLFQAFCKRLTVEEAAIQFPHISLEELKESIALLLAAQILVTEEERVSAQQWEFHDLSFHARSRGGRHDAPTGGTFRFQGKIPSLPVLKRCDREKIPLKKPAEDLHISLGAALEKRQSKRLHGTIPLSIDQLSSFLYHCARVIKTIPCDGEEVSKRPYPGAGARYELELYLVVHQCLDLLPAVYHYHPLEHELCKIRPLDGEAEKMLQDAQSASTAEEYPQVLLVIGARFQRVSWKYSSIAYALILKNTGVLYQTMYLVATAMGLAPCALGGGNSDLFCSVMGTNYLEESSVGEFMLGSLPGKK